MKYIVLICSIIACKYDIHSTQTFETIQPNPKSYIDTIGKTVSERFLPLDSFKRYTSDSTSFSYYLQHLPLKKFGELVKNFDGTEKSDDGIYLSVIDMEISKKNLQQCADAVMRLRGEYLFHQKMYSEISFLFNGDGKYHAYLEYSKNDRSYKKFRSYMDYVFTYANTASLHKQLTPIKITDMQIGDVLVKKGNPFGHAVIVLDMCYNSKGNKLFMLAQSYMPAQETQILSNPKSNSVWYEMPPSDEIITPEWTFTINDLRRW